MFQKAIPVWVEQQLNTHLVFHLEAQLTEPSVLRLSAADFYKVYLNGTQHPWVEDFTEEKVQKQTLEYAARSPEAVAITSGSYYWILHLEELFPPGFPETTMAEGEFQLRVVRGSSAQVYQVCRWSSVTRSFTAQGLRRICKGIALTRKEDLT